VGTPFLDIPDFSSGLRDDLADRFGLTRNQLDGLLRGGRGTPNTRARMSHGYTLRTAKGTPIGGVFATQVRQGLTIDTEWEIDVNAHGEPADMITQDLGERTFSIDRWDLNVRIMEEIFGTAELQMLTDQTNGFKLREIFRAPAGILGGGGRQYEYLNCKFTNLGRQQDATGDRVVRVNAELIWFGRRRVA